MMSNFDLNINNYKKDELLDMFDLPSNYDKDILEEQEYKLREGIVNNNKINQNTKSKTIEFLNQAKKILSDELIKNVKTLEKSFDNVKSFEKSFESVFHNNLELKEINVNNQNDHNVQERSETPYVSTSLSEFFPGVINKFKRRIIRKYLNIDTRFRDNYFSSQSTNYNLELPVKFTGTLSMLLTAIELPTCFYVISKQLGNNFFSIKIPETNESKIIEIQDGNYSNNELMNYINSILKSEDGLLKYIYFSVNITSSNSGNGNVIVGINSDAPQLFIFTLDFQTDKYGSEDNNTPLPLKFAWLLGFRNGQYINNYTYVSEGIINLTGPKYIYLVVDDFNNNVINSFYAAFNSSLLNKSVIARITLPLTSVGITNTFTQNNFTTVTYPREYLGPVDIQKLQIKLLDEYGRILDLNNMDYSFCLTLQCSYDL